MSHHYSGPNLGFPGGDARLDFTDLYAFPKPGDPSKSILIMNVHPSVGLNPPGPTTAEPFAPEALYETQDRHGRRRRRQYRVPGALCVFRRPGADRHAAPGGGRRRPPGRATAGKVIVEIAPVSTGRDARVTEAGEHRFFAGWRSDPFFFDAPGAMNNFQFTGDDFFADKDICSIVLEVSNSVLGPREVGLWARTLIPAKGADGSWVQVDRGARPSQTPFLTGEQNEAYRAGGAGGRCPFRRPLRARAGAYGRVYAGGSNAGGGDAATGPPALRPHAPSILSEQWPGAHRRRR